MKEMKHENLVQFFGACTEPPNVCLVMQYCRKGSLKVRLPACDASIWKHEPTQAETRTSTSQLSLMTIFQDVLSASDVELDGIFKLSFAYDIVNVSVETVFYF